MADEISPGTPFCEHVSDIKRRLIEIEAERARERQAAEPAEPAPVPDKNIEYFGD